MLCLLQVRVNRFLISLLAGFTVSLTTNGRVLAVPTPSEDPSGLDTAPTDLCSSRLGTVPMWHCTRLVYFHEALHYHNTDRIIQQSLQQNALAIAQTYKDSQRWVSAAQNLRAPYWDWATNSVPPPEVISLTTVTVLAAPDGNPTDVTNPLYQYTFNPIDPSFTPPYQYWQTTIRSPDNPGSPDATTDVALLTQYGPSFA